MLVHAFRDHTFESARSDCWITARSSLRNGMARFAALHESEGGTERPFAALPRFCLESEGLLPYRRALRQANS